MSGPGHQAVARTWVHSGLTGGISGRQSPNYCTIVELEKDLPPSAQMGNGAQRLRVHTRTLYRGIPQSCNRCPSVPSSLVPSSLQGRHTHDPCFPPCPARNSRCLQLRRTQFRSVLVCPPAVAPESIANGRPSRIPQPQRAGRVKAAACGVWSCFRFGCRRLGK